MLIVDMPIGSDLVDRAVLYERLKQWQDAAYDALTLSFLHEVKMLIGSAPHVKAVELVRCDECKRRYKPMDDDLRNEIWCEFMGSTMRKDDFCSYGSADGERKEGAE